jgi:hypothetical protein
VENATDFLAYSGGTAPVLHRLPSKARMGTRSSNGLTERRHA